MTKMKKYLPVFVVAALIFGIRETNAMFVSPQPITKQQVEDLKEKAALGDISAEIALAFTYYMPDTPGSIQYRAVGTDKDNKQALKYFRQAAEAGDALSQTYVGLFYDRGKVVDQDYKAALKWYQMAADQGYPYAQDLIGRMYRDGHGVPQNYSIAAEFFKKAVLQFHGNSNLHLGRLYFTGGPELPQDYEEAFFWLVLWENPAWPKGCALAPENDLCCENEDFTPPFYRDVEKHLTSAQIKKVKKQVKDYKMPPSTKWSPQCIKITPPADLRLLFSYPPSSNNQALPQPDNLNR